MELSRSRRFKAFILYYCRHLVQSLEENQVGRKDLPAFHQEWVSLIERPRLALVAPRSFAKSTYFSKMYPLFAALEGIHTDILMISSSSSLAEKFLRDIRNELESNEDIIRDYGEQQSDVWRNDELRLQNGVVIRARGAECKTRGYRPSLVLVDDLESEDTVWSELTRVKLERWFRNNLINVLNPNGQFIIIGTLLHPQSLLSKMMKQPPSKDWFVKKYQAILESGQSVWPSQWSLEKLQARRDEIGPDAFEQEFQNNPIPEGHQRFKLEYIRTYNELPRNVSYFTCVDPAKSTETRNDPDYTAIVTVAVDEWKNIYVCDITRDRLHPSETIEEIIRHYVEYRSEVIAVETEGFQYILKYDLEEELRKRKLFPYVKEISTGGIRKSFRIERLEPYFRKSKVFLHEQLRHLDSFIGELLIFPNGKHDDMIDALCNVIPLIHAASPEKKESLPSNAFGTYWKQHKRKKRLMRECPHIFEGKGRWRQ